MSVMRIFIGMGALVAAAVAVPGAAFAQPAAQAPAPVKVPLVNDCGNDSINGDCLALDMIGTFAGVVKSRHKQNGDLRIMVVVKSASANTAYGLEVYCGSSPQNPGTLAGSVPDAVRTDAMGAALAGPFEIAAADLSRSCAAGSVGHIQLVDVPGGSVLSGGPVQVTS